MSTELLKKFYQEYQIQTVLIGNKTWEYIKKGNGKKTLVILPGGFENAQITFEQIEVFQKNYKVIAITINDCDSIEELCFAINTILKKEKVKKIYLYGLSLTGLLVQSYTKRNKEKVKKLIISHAAAPASKTYKRKSILPLRLLQPFVFLMPISFIKYVTRLTAYKVQTGLNRKFELPKEREKNQKFFRAVLQEFSEKYFNRRFIKTLYRLHYDFVKEKFSPDDFVDWKGQVLILQTDNDPLMADDGEFKKLYPHAQVVTFHGTGHMTLYFQFPEMIATIQKFLKL